MEEPRYLNREIDHFMNEFDKRMTHQDDMLTEIKMVGGKNNIRIGKHSFQIRIMWVIVCVAASVIMVVGPFMYNVVLAQIQNDFQKSQQAIEDSDQKYIDKKMKVITDTFSQYHIIVNTNE